MMIVPFRVSETHYSIYVILEDDNIARMKKYDPAEVILHHLPPEVHQLKLKDIVIGYATADDLALATVYIKAGKVSNALRYLSRGWKFLPSEGDNDQPYVSLLKKPN